MSDIDQKLDTIASDIKKIEVSQARTEIIMDTHIKRTQLAEESIELLRQELKPIKKHVDMINMLAYVVSGGGALLVILKELGLLDKILKILP